MSDTKKRGAGGKRNAGPVTGVPRLDATSSPEGQILGRAIMVKTMMKSATVSTIPRTIM
jgi:hypothetical protein